MSPEPSPVATAPAKQISHPVAKGWFVHSFTALGAVCGMFGLIAVADGQAREAIVWLAVAMVLDGVDGVRVHASGSSNLPVEALEHAYPLRVERYALRDGSGGQGLHPGGFNAPLQWCAWHDYTGSYSTVTNNYGPNTNGYYYGSGTCYGYTCQVYQVPYYSAGCNSACGTQWYGVTPYGGYYIPQNSNSISIGGSFSW